jgi:hypothetical protein
MFYVLHSIAIILLSVLSFWIGYSVAEDTWVKRFFTTKKEK